VPRHGKDRDLIFSRTKEDFTTEIEKVKEGKADFPVVVDPMAE